MQRIPSAGTAISRAAAAEIPSRMHRPDRALAALAALPMSMRPRTQTAIIIARLRSKTARILHSIKNLFRLRRLLHRRIPYNPPPKRWRAHSLKPRLLEPASSRTPRAKPPYRPAPDVHRAMWQRRRTMQRPRQQKPRPVRRIIPQELRSLSWAARSCKMRSRNNPYISNQNPIRAAAHRHRIMLARFRSVRQEKRQAKNRRAAPISQPAAQESRITAATHRCSLRIQKRRSSAVPLCRLRTWQARSQQQNIQLLLLLRGSAWQEIRLCRTAARRQFPRKTVWQENSQILIPHRSAIPQEMARGHSNRVAHRIRRRPVRQERSARPSAGAIPSPCSRRRAFPRMEIPRSRSRIMFQPSSPAARCSRPAESVWMAAPQIGSIPHLQRRYLRQRRLPTAKLVRPHVRPRGLMRHVRQNNALRSAQFPRKAAAQKSRYRRLAHIRLLFPQLLPNGRAGNRLPQLLWAA